MANLASIKFDYGMRIINDGSTMYYVLQKENSSHRWWTSIMYGQMCK